MRSDLMKTAGQALFIMLLLVSAAGVSAATPSADSYRYTERTGDRVTRFDWEMQGRNPVTIISTEPDKRFRNICLPDGSQVAWEFSSATERMEIVREGNTLRFKGNRAGKQIEKTEKLDGDPWFQALSFSLRQWLTSGGDSVRFWMVRPDDLDMHRMKAEREAVEPVEVNGRQVEAQRVRVKLSGAFAMFWSVSYWFRTGDYLLVRYEGVHGPPGTPQTVVQLDE